MLSKTSLRFLRFAFKACSFWNFCPYGWDSRRNRVSPASSKGKFALFLSNVFLMVVYEIYVLYRVTQASIPGDRKVSDVVRVAYNAVLYMLPLSVQYNIIFRRRDIPAFVNGYLTVYERFGEHYFLTGMKRHKNGCEATLKALRFCTVPIVAQSLVQILKAPSSAIFFTSLLPDEYLNKLIYRLPLMMVHWVIWMTIVVSILFTSGILYLYVFPAVFMLREMAQSNRLSESTHENLRTPGVFVSLYRTLQVQHALFHHCFQYMLLPSNKAIVSAVAILGIYGAIKIPGPRAMSMGVIAGLVFLYLNTFFNSLARCNTASQRLLESWRGRDKYIRKFIRSCRPLSVHLGNYYYVSQTTVLVLYGVIVNATITLLLT